MQYDCVQWPYQISHPPCPLPDTAPCILFIHAGFYDHDLVYNAGKYSDHYKSATNIYKSSDWEDDMSWGAAWLYLATEDSKYLDEASKYWSSKYWDMTVGWDNSGAATAIMLYNIDQQKGVDVPHITQITHYVEDQFLPAWINSNGMFARDNFDSVSVKVSSTHHSCTHNTEER